MTKFLLAFVVLFLVLATSFVHLLPNPTNRLRGNNPILYWFIIFVIVVDVIFLVGNVAWYVWVFIK